MSYVSYPCALSRLWQLHLGYILRYKNHSWFNCAIVSVTFENISRFQNQVERRLFKKFSVATESNAYRNKLTFKQHHPAIEMLFQKDTIKGTWICNVKLKVLALDLICVLCIMYYFYQNLYTLFLFSSWGSRALSIILPSVYSTMEILALKQN